MPVSDSKKALAITYCSRTTDMTLSRSALSVSVLDYHQDANSIKLDLKSLLSLERNAFAFHRHGILYRVPRRHFPT